MLYLFFRRQLSNKREITPHNVEALKPVQTTMCKDTEIKNEKLLVLTYF